MGMDPTIAGWSREAVGQQVMDGADWDELTLMVLATKQEAAGVPPDEVLVAWHRSLASSRAALRQSEMAFLHSARQAGWTDARIVEVLGLGSGDLDEHQRNLELEDAAQHPSQRPEPWTGGRWVGHSS